MKKRITGIVAAGSRNKPPKKIKIKGWKVNPYLFIHKSLDDNLEPVREPSWVVTHIPTGLALKKSIRLSRKFTLWQLRTIVDKWFPSWIAKTLTKRKEQTITEEATIRWRAMCKEINARTHKTFLWRI